MEFDQLSTPVKNELIHLGIIGIDEDGNFMFDEEVSEDEMGEREELAVSMIEKEMQTGDDATAKKAKDVKEKKSEAIAVQDVPRKYQLAFTKNELELATEFHRFMQEIGSNILIKDVLFHFMMNGISDVDKQGIIELAKEREISEKMTSYLKQNKLKLSKDDLLLHLLNENLH